MKRTLRGSMRALDLALELTRDPTLASAMREQSLPPDTLVVIRIAAGCRDTVQEALSLTGAPAETLKEAAVLYLQKILLAPDSDCYRVLGVQPDAPRVKMREHMRWLIKWLHPDRDPNDWESVFAERVLKAWREAGKSPRVKRQEDEPTPRSRFKHVRQRWVAFPIPSNKGKTRWPIAAALILLVGLGLAFFAAPAILAVSKQPTPETAEAVAPQ